MQTSDKERFIWLRNSLSSCLCPDCEYKGRLRHAALCSPPCVLPLRPPREGAVVHKRHGQRTSQELATIIEHVSGCKVLPSEGGAHGQPEVLARPPERVERAVELLGLRVAEVACAARREHVAGNQVFAADLFQQPEWIVGVVDAERRTDNG